MRRAHICMCDLCPYEASARIETDAVRILFAHLLTVHPSEVGAPDGPHLSSL